ncbi:MAG: ABC transporter permease [Clostridia bacterium]|nr:ABC transporter permease [Clostridia bacterium]
MYIIKNALRCISRAKSRNILIGVIVFIIAVSSCIGLSIRQAAESAKEETLNSMSVTATISFDRSSAMKDFTPTEKPEQGGEGGFDRNSFKEMMGKASSLSLDEYLKYAQAHSVEDFYYSLTVYANGDDSFEPVSNDSTEQTQNGSMENMPKGMSSGKAGRIFGQDSDFTLVGYSSETAMTSFADGTASVTDGVVFSEGTENFDCIISEELAAYNDLAVGDTVNLVNPNNEEEIYTLAVVGIYIDSSANESSFSPFGSTSTDPANSIYLSYNALNSIVTSSEETNTSEDDSETAALSGNLEGTYVFADVDSYEKFEEQVRDLGLDESYTVTSSDITAFENSLTPLNTLSKTAGYFLIVILLIGAVILVVLNIFNVRERKYEIGVLTAIGMKKGKVALQFLTEIFVVTLAAIILGAGIGAVSSVPVTNALLANQIESTNTRAEQTEQNFGRGPNLMEDGTNGKAPTAPDSKGGGMGGFMDMFNPESENNYVTEISSATNLTVILQMLGIGILLTLIAGAASMLFVMRYEPLKILANRD